MTHTFLSIAHDCGVKKDQIKYVYRKLKSELGQVINGTRTFTDNERNQIVQAGNFDPLATALSTEIVIAPNALDTYDPTTNFNGQMVTYHAPEFRPTDKGELMINFLCQQSQAGGNSATNALLQNSQNEGTQLGAAMANLKIKAAIDEQNRLMSKFYESQGLEVSQNA